MATPQVIVVGAGLSGLSAAHTLYEKGGNVLVLEKNPFAGGNSTKATSGINGAGTKAQQALGIKDSAAAFFADTKKSARDLARDDLIEVLTGKSADAVNWLCDRFNLDLSKVSRLGGHSFERTHRGGEQFPGMTITYALMEKLEDLAESDPTRVKILKKANVRKLVKDGDKVVGCEYEYQGKQHTAHGPVILATGGYAADFAQDGLLAKYRPELLKLSTTNGDHCQGDGQKMAMAIGANGIDLEKVQVHPTGLVDPREPDAKVKFLAAEALRGVGGLLVNKEGDRFADELGHRDYVTGRIWEDNKRPVRLVLNGQAGKEIEWHCKHYVGRGLMKKFDTVADIAKEMGIEASKLQKTFNEYMEICEGKRQDPFGKKFFHNTNWKNEAGPFFVAQMEPVLHYTMGGLEIDPRSMVLDSNKKPIEGLFASGEIAGGVHGANRLGGSSLLGCVVFGRVAGDSAASYLLKSLSSGSGAVARLGQVNNHLAPPSTTITIDPSTQQVHLTLNWSGQGQGQAQGSAGDVKPQGESTAQQPANEVSTAVKQDEETKAGGGEKAAEQKEYSLDEVAKHNTKDDIWIAVNGQVLNVTNFLNDHPGGAKALLLYAGKEASEEFNMLHDPKVVSRYAPDTVIGTYKQ
ncbi:RHTO0S11e07008g1_1 [Rhodotorula toruloides]|uniref:fumarate reductase (NADH) n=2 Tax=Rhodotorula toruloides TaxID=5286 RepID=A0A061B9B8_RHOTO|nr:fumarate reductase flavoprotein subunit [Rhodotorula toruloides NP11]EMS21500.1 fumarate reductase flavoprotein subunit [Rhodotorula toruloides NP11]CDR45974.1 RHTO0S11e07008g1_1 [Rhodotorula toruloides]